MLHHILYFWLTSDWKQKKVQNDFFKFCESKGIARIYGIPYNPARRNSEGIQLNCSMFTSAKDYKKDNII